MTLVKICGVRDPGTATAAAKAGADFAGMVFAESRRRVTPQECYDVVEALRAFRRRSDISVFDGPQPGEVRGSSWFALWADAVEQAVLRWRPLIVGVFAGQTVAEVNDIAEAAGLDLVQLSGGEDEDYIRSIRRPVISAIHIDSAMTAGGVRERATPGRAAIIMLDTKLGEARGGTGATFDWSVAEDLARDQPLMLAGGLTPENVGAAIERVRPWAVDVSSGVETGGSKDPEKIGAFIRAAKGVRVDG